MASYSQRMKAAKDREARIKELPREVAQAVAAMPPEEQDRYLASLEKVDDMEAKGETFTPNVDPAAPWGTTKDGKPRAKPGRKPTKAAGARTAEKMERSMDHPELVAQRMQALEAVIGDEHPEDDPEVPVTFGYTSDGEPPSGVPAAPPRLTEEQREAQERAEQQAQLEEALRQQGLRTDDVLVGPFAAVRLVPVGDPEDLANYHVDRLDCELRMIDTTKAYRLEIRYPPSETWEAIAETYEPSGAAGTMARMKVQPVDSDAFGRALGALDKPHRAVAARFDNRPRDARGPANERERDLLNNEVRAQMIEQRRSIALHRQPGDAQGYSWLSN